VTGVQTCALPISYPEDFVLVIDTREQAGLYRRPPKGLVVVRDTLPAGDYSVRGFETEVVIERKSVMDLYNSMFGDWVRELKKLEKIKEYHRKWLVVDGSEDEVLRWQEYSQVHPNSMRGRLCAIDVRLGIPIHYAATRQDAERFVLDRLIRYYKDKRDNKNGFDK
jgi:ERCC4-type nuclease